MLRAFGGTSPERPGGRGKPRLAVAVCSAPDVPAARPAVCRRVPLREAERKINAHDQPAGPAAQPDQFIAELWPRPAVLQAVEHAVLDHGHPRSPAPVVQAARPVDGDQHEFRHGVIVNPRPPVRRGAQEIVIEKPRYGLSWFRISFGRLQLKAYTKGEHVLRFEATGHNAKQLRCRRSLDNFDQIITRLAEMADRFAAALDCADIGFLPDGVLDELPLPAQAGASWIAGIDLNKPRIRAALAPPSAARTISALLTLRDHVIARSWPESAAPARAASRQSGPPIATTRISASACKPCSSTSASRRSQQPHRQHLSIRECTLLSRRTGPHATGPGPWRPG